MRILALSQWYPPEPDIRAGVLARELADRGHAVTALTGFPNYPNGRIYPGYEQRLRSVERDGAARVVRVPLYPSHSHSAFGRVLTYGTFAASAMLLGGPATGSIDVVWAYHPPITTGLAAVVIGAARRAPFVFEIQDMWPETLAATGMVRGGAFLSGVGAMARWIYERAAAISVISPGFKRNLIAKGVSGEKIVVIPNWADETVYRPMPRDPTAARAAGLPTGFIVLYAGNMGPAQDLLNVLRAAKQLTDLAEVRFVFVGDGVDLPLLRAEAKKAALRNVHFLPRRPAAEMPSLYANADALLVHLSPDPLFEITIPSKTIAYLASGRPIITVSRGDPAAVVADAGAGVTCAPGDPTALARVVRALYAMPAERRDEMATSGRRAYDAKYTRRVAIDRYEELFDAIRLGRRP